MRIGNGWRPAKRQTAPRRERKRRGARGLPCELFFVSALSSSFAVPPPPPSSARTDSAEARSPARRREGAHVIAGWKRVIAWLAGGIVRVWCATLHLQADARARRLMAGDKRPTLFVLWHNRLFVAAELSRRLRHSRPLHGLVSTSKDGAWLSAFFESAGLRVVRGSSSRGGREAAAGLVEVMRAGNDAGITPDGPRGPVYVCKPGAVVVARRAKARVLVVGLHYEHSLTVGSWDRFQIPLPFSRFRLSAAELDEGLIAAEDAREKIEAILRDLNRDASSQPPPAV